MPVVANHMTQDLLTVEANTRLGDAAERMAERLSEQSSSSTASAWRASSRSGTS